MAQRRPQSGLAVTGRAFADDFEVRAFSAPLQLTATGSPGGAMIFEVVGAAPGHRGPATRDQAGSKRARPTVARRSRRLAPPADVRSAWL